MPSWIWPSRTKARAWPRASRALSRSRPRASYSERTEANCSAADACWPDCNAISAARSNNTSRSDGSSASCAAKAVDTPRRLGGTQPGGTGARSAVRRQRLSADLGGVVVSLSSEQRIAVVRRDDLGHVFTVVVEDRSQVRRYREMARLAFLLRQHVVGDIAQESLREDVLTPFGRQFVSADRQELLAHQAGQTFVEAFAGSGNCRNCGSVEAAAEHGQVFDQRTLVGG